MSKFITGNFTFDEPPCYCAHKECWNWGIYTSNGKYGMYIQCPHCKVKVYVPNDDWRMGVRFSQEQKKYDVVDDCKVIPFRKRK